MKTTLALLIAGLLFLATPMLASADSRHYGNGQNHYKGWVKSDRHDQRSYYDRHNQRRPYHYDTRRDHRHDQKRDHRAKKQLRQKLRETRQELRQAKRQNRHNDRRPYSTRPYYKNPAVVIGLPHLVFQFDW